MQHGIEQVRVHPNQPCFDLVEYNSATNQQFYFGELQRSHRSCSKPGKGYGMMEVPEAEDTVYTEYEF